MFIRKTLLILLCVCFFPLQALAAIQVFHLQNLGYSQDLAIKGSQTTTSLRFPIPYVQLQTPSVILLQLVPAKTLNPNSTFTIQVNGQQAAQLTAAQLAAQPEIQLALPPESAQQGYAEVNISTHMFAGDRICEDYFRGLLSYTIKNTSYVSYNYAPASIQTIPEFFASWVRGALLILPDKPTLSEIQAGIWLYAALQKLYPHEQIQLVSAAEQGALPPDLPRIWLGLRPNLPGTLKEGVHLFLANPQTLIVTADSDEELSQQAQQLLSTSIQSVIPASALVISSNQTVSLPDKKKVFFGNAHALSGHTDIVLDFPLYPSQLKALPQELGIHLDAAYTPNTLSDHKVRMDVFMNGHLLFSQALDNSGRVNQNISMPMSISLKTRNLLSVQFIYPEEQGRCPVRGTLSYAQVLPSSYFTGTGSSFSHTYAWDSMGMNFNRKGLILLEDTTSFDWIRAAGALNLYMNQQLPTGQYAYPLIASLADWEKSHKADFMAVLGTTKTIPKELLSGSNFWFGTTQTVYTADKKTIQYTYDALSPQVTGFIGEYKGIPLMTFSATAGATQMEPALRFLSKQPPEKLMGDIFIFKNNQGTFLSLFPPEETLLERGFFNALIPWDWSESILDFVFQYYRYLLLVLLLLILLATYRINRFLTKK